MTRPTDRGRAVGLTLGAVFALLTALLVPSLVLAPRAEAYIYWTNSTPARSGAPNSTAPGSSFILARRSGVAMAVDAGHVYWTTKWRQDRPRQARRHRHRSELRHGSFRGSGRRLRRLV